uniref:CCHC-type domain-containing protein n=1 Tax=Graphocephala atropunctata TaxID=36148 RepID=A0A1B6L3L9_9HEMI
MAKFNLNYLLKDELTYELLARGEELKYDNVEDLRKQLRKHLNQIPEPKHLSGKISLQSEIKTIQCKLDFIEVLVNQTTENTSRLSVAKIKAKLSHIQLRISNLSKCKLEPTYLTELENLSQKLTLITNEFQAHKIKFSEEELTNFEEELNQSFIEEEEQNNKLENFLPTDGKITSTPINTPTLVQPQVEVVHENVNLGRPIYHSPTQHPGNQTCTPEYSPIFNKLANPIEKLLNKFVICDGLVVNMLLLFLRNLLELRTQTNLTATQIYEILPSFTAAPLLNKVLQCKTACYSLDQLHNQIISTFLPITLREKLKQDLVIRPQKPQEPLSIYINEVKINSQILQTGMTESEVVVFIKNGLSPEVRNKLIFETNPTSFQDLDQLCINANNIQYNDFLRNQLYPERSTYQSHPQAGNSRFKTEIPTNNFNFPQHRQPSEKICFNCNRKGHIAKHCYRPKIPKNL